MVHGGAGTTGEALRSGKPIVGIPFAYDHFTLCERIAELGLGVRLPVRTRTRHDFAAAFAHVLSDEAMKSRTAAAGARFAAEPDGAESGADVIERLVG